MSWVASSVALALLLTLLVLLILIETWRNR